MVHLTNRKIVIFLFIFLFLKTAFAFDAKSTHPALTEEIVKYYNAFTETKITPEELELIKLGSIKEDNAPRFVNHFYDPIHNSGVRAETFSGGQFWYEKFLGSLPHSPLKSIDWLHNNTVQDLYNDIRTWERAGNLYHLNKKEALLTLGYILHLLEDLGVPEHSRGDAHGGFFGDPKSNYEEYAKEITDNYKLNFADKLIKENIKPPSFSDINSIFSSLANFTANNWFSQDTINGWNVPKIKIKFEEGNKIYYENQIGNTVLISVIKEKGRIKEIEYIITDPIIHQQWFNTVVPEIIKHGAALLKLYFNERKAETVSEPEAEISELMAAYQERNIGLLQFLSFPTNLISHLKTSLWSGAHSVAELTTNFIQSIANLTSAIFGKQEQSKELSNLSQLPALTKPQKENLNQQKNISQENKVTYQEEKKEIKIPVINEIKSEPTSKNKETKAKIETPASTITKITTTITTKTATITTTSLVSRKQIISTSTNNINSQLTYIGGGGVSSVTKDPCENYKNNQYPNILISEIQFELATNTKDEFIELYNPTNQEIDLTCWKLEKYSAKDPDSTSTPTLTTLIPQSKFQGKIKPFSFFLITSSSTKEKYQGDLNYAESYSISKNNVIILRKPNNEISDLVGYGDKEEKIYQFETKPFLAENFQNKSIQRKNLQDTNNNFEDFWLRAPNPENSNSQARRPREDFIDLAKIKIENFNVFSTLTEESTFLTLSFQEPTTSVSSTNYAYNLLISTSTNFNTFYLSDFGINQALPQPKFNSSTILTFEITKCPTTSTLYYFGLYLKDNLDNENKSPFSVSSTTLPDYLCNPQEPKILTTSTSTATSTGKILFSEIRVISGTSTGEYIELYNPNDFDLDLTGWRIERVKSTGTTSPIIPSSKFKGIIPSYSYFLLVNANTSSNLTINPDIIYAKSNDLASNNGLKLYDKNNNLIDEIFWQDATNTKSFHRKKTASSTPESLFGEENNLPNAYDTNQNTDFILANPEPQNSSVRKIPLKEIKNFKIEKVGNLFRLSWFSPTFYDQALIYELKFATDTSFSSSSTVASTTFSLLSNQTLDFDICKNFPEINVDTNLYFRLNLLRNDLILASSTTSTKMFNCKDITNSFSKIEKNTLFISGYFVSIVGFEWKYEVLNNAKIEKISCNFLPSLYGPIFNPSGLLIQVKKLVTTSTEDSSTTTEEILYDSTTQGGGGYSILEGGSIVVYASFPQPLVLYKNDLIKIIIRSSEMTPAYDINFQGILIQ